MTAATGILSFGAYLPRNRLQRAAIHAANAWFAPGLRMPTSAVMRTSAGDSYVATEVVAAARQGERVSLR